MAPEPHYLYYTKEGTKSTKPYSNLCKNFLAQKSITGLDVMLYAWNLRPREVVIKSSRPAGLLREIVYQWRDGKEE